VVITISAALSKTASVTQVLSLQGDNTIHYNSCIMKHMCGSSFLTEKFGDLPLESPPTFIDQFVETDCEDLYMIE